MYVRGGDRVFSAGWDSLPDWFTTANNWPRVSGHHHIWTDQTSCNSIWERGKYPLEQQPRRCTAAIIKVKWSMESRAEWWMMRNEPLLCSHSVTIINPDEEQIKSSVAVWVRCTFIPSAKREYCVINRAAGTIQVYQAANWLVMNYLPAEEPERQYKLPPAVVGGKHLDHCWLQAFADGGVLDTENPAWAIHTVYSTDWANWSRRCPTGNLTFHNFRATSRFFYISRQCFHK